MTVEVLHLVGLPPFIMFVIRVDGAKAAAWMNGQGLALVSFMAQLALLKEPLREQTVRYLMAATAHRGNGHG